MTDMDIKTRKGYKMCARTQGKLWANPAYNPGGLLGPSLLFFSL